MSVDNLSNLSTLEITVKLIGTNLSHQPKYFYTSLTSLSSISLSLSLRFMNCLTLCVLAKC